MSHESAGRCSCSFRVSRSSSSAHNVKLGLLALQAKPFSSAFGSVNDKTVRLYQPAVPVIHCHSLLSRAKVLWIRVRKMRYPRAYLKMQLHLECVEVSLYRVEVTVWDRCVKCRVRVLRGLGLACEPKAELKVWPGG